MSTEWKMPSEQEAREAFWDCYPDTGDSTKCDLWMTAFRWCRAMLAGITAEAADELERLTRENLELQAKLEEARKDAERYRWLRDVAWNDGTLCYFDTRYGNEEWDDKIDAAMSQEK